MNVQSLVGKKIDQTQGFLEDGTRVPLSIISVAGNVVSQIKTVDHEGYSAIQVGFGNIKRQTKPIAGHIKKAGLTQTPRFFRELRVDDTNDAATGAILAVAEVFEPGDIVDVVGVSKGKGYAGAVKLHGFHGGPKTHGQSDRHRAPGSSGQGTTPGRVYKGKRMSGKMGNDQVTVKNLEVLAIDGDTIFVKGLIPGTRGAIVVINKVGKNKKFTPLWSDKPTEEAAPEIAVVEEAPIETAVETVNDATETVQTPEEKVETAQETVETASENIQTEEKVEEVPAEKVEEKTEEVDQTKEENASK